MVPPVSRRVSRAPRYSGCGLVGESRYPYGAVTRYGRPFQAVPVPHPSRCPSHNPARALTRAVWAHPLSLAATKGITNLFSSPAATKMFQFTAFAPLSRWPCGRVPPFGHPRVNGCLRLAGECRGLSRPSSPLGARASSVRPCLSSPRGPRLLAAPPVSLSMMSMCVVGPWPPCGAAAADGGEYRIRTDDPLLAGQVL